MSGRNVSKATRAHLGLSRIFTPVLLAGLLSSAVGCAPVKTRMAAQSEYTAGLAQLEEGDANAAETSFQAGLAQGSTSKEINGHLYAGLAEAYSRQYRLDAAVDAARKGVELISDSTTLIALSEALLVNRQSQAAFDTAKQAVEHCNTVANSNPDMAKRCYAEGFLMLGRVVRAVGQYEYALEQFDQAFNNGSKESTILGEKAQVLNLQGDPAKGKAMAEQALGKDADNEEALLARGTAEMLQGNASAARETLEPLLKKNPLATLEFLRVARSFVDKADYAQAVVMYEMVSAIQASNSYLWMDLGYAYQQSGEKEKSAAAYDKVLQVHPDLSAVAAAADTQTFKRMVDTGLADGSIAGDQIEFLTVAYTNVGNAQYSLGNTAGATEAYRRVMIVDPADVQVALILAGLLSGKGQEQEQMAALEAGASAVQRARAELDANSDSMEASAVKATKDELDRVEADIEKRLGVTLYNLGKQAEAAPHLARAVELAPDDPNVQLGLGLVLFNDEKFAECIPHLEKALTANPGDHGIIFSLGVAYRRTGENAKAVKLLEQAKKSDPRNKDIYLELHHAYKALGKTKEASDHQKMYQSLP